MYFSYKKNNAHFSQKSLSLMVFMAPYLATIATFHHQMLAECC